MLPEPTRVTEGTREDAAHRGLMRARAQWLLDKGIEQWKFLLDESWGDKIMAGRVRDHEVYLFEDADGPLGTVALYLHDTDVWPPDQYPPDLALHVHGLATRLTAPKGTGAALLAWAEHQALARGRPLTRLDCWDTNPALKAYYARLGYQDRGYCEPYGPNYPTRRWEKVLRPPSRQTAPI